MKTYGTTQRQIAAVAAKNHLHSVHNPLAQFQKAFSIDEVLASPPIAYPLTTLMCSAISDGAAAVVLCNAAGLKKLGGAGRAVKVLASVIQTGSNRGLEEREKIVAHLAARKAYELAGVPPGDVSVAEVHDASAMGEILNAESLMLVPFGQGGPAAERGDFTVGGRIPINPSGGLHGKHPRDGLERRGLARAVGPDEGHQLAPADLQRDALHGLDAAQFRARRQVEKARIAIQENGGGLFGIEEAVVAVNLFAKP